MSKIYLLNEQKFDGVENLEVFEIEYLKFDLDLKKYDALVFTSKNAIFSLEENGINWKNIPSYVIAPKTADIAKKVGANIAFIGFSGHGNDFANELIPYLKDKKTLYIRALKTVSNLTNILKENGINIDEIIAYKTSCNKKERKSLDKNSTIIFTSPPNDVTSNFEDVTVSASFCFCETAIVFDAVPALMRTDALRSSGVSLSFALIVIDASPAVPLWGVTLNQPSARSFTISAIQSAVAENEILSSSANSSNETEDLLSVIVGVVGVLPPPLSEPLSAGSLFEQATIDTTVSK